MASRNVLTVNTGNIIPFNDLKKKIKQNPSEELVEALKIGRNESPSKRDDPSALTKDGDAALSETESNELKISVKVFITEADKKTLAKALDQVLTSLDTDFVESVVIAYDTADKTQENLLSGLKELWGIVEDYVRRGKFSHAGVSDVDADVFVRLHEWATDVKPNIVQINLVNCCVVPPALQEFTKKNFIQLLTHNDPCQILPAEAVTQIFGSDATLSWVARYQIQLKCRGVLASKGYLVSVIKKQKETSG